MKAGRGRRRRHQQREGRRFHTPRPAAWLRRASDRDALARRGLAIGTLHVTGGHTKNPLLMELYAGATGCTAVAPAGEDVLVLLGTPMVAAAASGLYPDVGSACVAMRQPGRVRH